MFFVAHFQLIADSFGILALLQVLITENFDILALFQALIADTSGIFHTLRENERHPGLKPMTSAIRTRYFTNCTTNSLRRMYIKETQHACSTGDL